LQAGGRLLRAGDNLADDLLGAFGGRQLALEGVGNSGLPSRGNNVPLSQDNRPLAIITNRGGNPNQSTAVVPGASNSLGSLPPVPTPSSNSPISIDEALDLSEQFLIPGIPVNFAQSGTGIQVIQQTTNSQGQSIVRRIGFDVNPNSAHVRRFGPHLNLQTQVDGVIQRGALADPHIPIDPSTVRPGDF